MAKELGDLYKEELKDLTIKHAASSKTLQEKRSEYEIIKNKLEDQISRCSKLADENIVNNQELYANTIQVYPNPFQNSLSIYSTLILNIVYKIYDINGNLVSHDYLVLGNKTKNINLEHLNSGVYMIMLSDENNQLISQKRIVKIN